MTKLIAARVQARIEKKQIEIGLDTNSGVGGGPFLLMKCMAANELYEGSGVCSCVECLPYVGDGFSSVECLVPLSRYVYMECDKGCKLACHAVLPRTCQVQRPDERRRFYEHPRQLGTGQHTVQGR